MLRPCSMILVALAFVVACGGDGGGGSGGGASVPSSAAGKASISGSAKGEKFTAAGPAFARFNAQSKQLVIYVVDGKSTPLPNCEHLAVSMASMKRGAFVSLDVFDFPGKAGTYKAGDVNYTTGDADKGDMHGVGGDSEKTTIVLDRYDDKSFSGTVKTEGKPDVQAEGSFQGPVCPWM